MIRIVSNRRFIKIIIIFGLFTYSFSSYAGCNEDNEKLKRIDSLNNVAHRYFLKNNKEGVAIANQALKEATAINYLYGVSLARNKLALYLTIDTEYRESLEQLFISIDTLKSLLSEKDLNDDLMKKYNKAMYSTYLLIFNVYRILDYNDMQFKYSKLAEEYLLKSNYKQSELIRIKATKASVYHQLGLLDKSLSLYEEIMVYFKDKQDTLIMADLNTVISGIYLEKNELPKASNIADTALYLAKKIGQEVIIQNTLLLKAEIFNKQGKFKKALKYADKVTNSSKEESNKAYIDLEKGKAFLGMKDIGKAEKLLESSLSLFLKKNNKSRIKETTEFLKKVYTQTNNISKLAELNLVIEKYEKELLESKLAVSLGGLNKNEPSSMDETYINSLIGYDDKVSLLTKTFLILLVLFIAIWLLKKFFLTKN